MKTIIVLGSGNSGAGAIRDFLCQEKTSKVHLVIKNLEL